MDRTGKDQLIKEVSEKFKMSRAVFLTEYRGLSVAELTEIRSELFKVQAKMQVIKNRLTKRALAGDDLPDLDEYLSGPIAITFAEEDPVGAAKVLTKYAEEFEPLAIRAAVVRGKLISLNEVKALSKLPSKEELYAKLLATLMAPVTNVARTLAGVSTKFVRTLAAVRDTKS